MPNWVHNELALEGDKDDILSLIEKVAGGDRKGFDFNCILPMPETMQVTVGSYEDDNLRYYCLLAGKAMPEGKFRSDLPVGKGYPTLAAYQMFDKAHPDTLSVAEGKKIYINLTEHGCKDWYEWAVKHWGTKWNACQPTGFQVLDAVTYTSFNTAWNAPYPLLEALSRMYPHITLRMTSTYEEGFVERSEYCAGEEIFFDRDDCNEA